MSHSSVVELGDFIKTQIDNWCPEVYRNERIEVRLARAFMHVTSYAADADRVRLGLPPVRPLNSYPNPQVGYLKQEEGKKLRVSHPHLWLYCKQHYKQSDSEMDDMRKVVAHFCGARLEQIRPADVLKLLQAAAEEACIHCYPQHYRAIFNQLRDVLSYDELGRMFGKGEPEMTKTQYLMRVYRNLIMFAPCSHIDLPEADPNVLPVA